VEAAIEPPGDPELLSEVMAIRLDVARADVLTFGGLVDEATEVADTAVIRARRAGYRPVEAEAMLAAACARWETGTHADVAAKAEEAALVAESAGDYATFVRAAVEVAATLAIGQLRNQEAEGWIRRAEATRERLGEDPDVDAHVAYGRGSLLLMQGDHEASLEPLERAATLFEELYGEDAIELTYALNNLAVAQRLVGDLESAGRNLDRHADLIERRLGRDSQHMAYALLNRGSMMMAQGDPEQALLYTKRGLEIVENGTPERHARRALALSIVGSNLRQLDRMEEALDYLERAVTAQEGVGFDFQAASAFVGLTSTLSDFGRHEEALKSAQKYLALLEKQFSGDELARDEMYPAVMAHAAAEAGLSGQFDLAHQLSTRSLELLEARDAEGEPLVVPRYALAQALAGLGREPKRAAELAAAALAGVRAFEHKEAEMASKGRAVKKRAPADERWWSRMKIWLEAHAGAQPG
jgi:tetratricopeptide (TPR) repeat protein